MNEKPAKYGEPWRMDAGGLTTEAYCVDRDDTFIAGRSSDEGFIQANDPIWARIVACVNACRGIPTESLLNQDCQIHVTYKLGGKHPGGEA